MAKVLTDEEVKDLSWQGFVTACRRMWPDNRELLDTLVNPSASDPQISKALWSARRTLPPDPTCHEIRILFASGEQRKLLEIAELRAQGAMLQHGLRFALKRRGASMIA